MKENRMYLLKTVEALERLLNSYEEICFYGAGYYLDVVLQELEKLGRAYLKKIKNILVTDPDRNPDTIRGIPVIGYYRATIGPGDCVLLTLGHRYAGEIYELLKDTGANMVQIDFNMFQREAYLDVKKSLQPFIDGFPGNLSGENQPICTEEITAWTCWWQGETQAPELVQACLESQRKNLPEGVRYVVITEDNYRDYISLPEYITEKAQRGSITLTALSDMIRATLLYRYGGFWLDATLLICQPLEKTMLEYPIYTRNLPETQYCTDAMWSGWFLYVKRSGERIFAFLMESFFYYFSLHDKLKYYFMIDYVIAIGCNTFPEVKAQFKAVPYNNEGAQELVKHLTEPFEQRRMEEYMKGASIQKLTYKLGQIAEGNITGTVYEYIIKKYVPRGNRKGGRIEL